MKNKLVIFLILISCLGIGLLLAQTEKNTNSQSTPRPNLTNSQSITDHLAIERQREERIRQTAEMVTNQYRTPIQFYGKVIDEKQQPVSNVNVTFEWWNVDKQNAVKRETQSDAQGNFSLENAQSKTLTVRIKKEGYYIDHPNNQIQFEYVDRTEKDFYIPDPSNPVIFRVRKEGQTEDLIFREQQINLNDSNQADFKISNFDLKPEINFEIIENYPDSKKIWSAKLSLPEGGIQINTNYFPLLAPQDNYIPEIIINRESPKPPGWPAIYQGGSFFVKIKNNYGRMELKMIPGKNKFYVESYFNPSGSPNLEVGKNESGMPK